MKGQGMVTGQTEDESVNTNQAHLPMMSICGKRREITLGRVVIEMLDYPCFVTLRISKNGDHVVAEEPKLYWEHATFVEAASSGENLKSLLGKAINAIICPDEYSGKLKYATWFSNKHHCIFQFAYSELEADI